MSISSIERTLLEYFNNLNESKQEQLIDFALFLNNQEQGSNDLSNKKKEPANIPRPENESVIQAISRLSKTYSMLSKTKLLAPASELLSSSVMQKADPKATIDKLEIEFKNNYQEYLGDADWLI